MDKCGKLGLQNYVNILPNHLFEQNQDWENQTYFDYRFFEILNSF